MKIKAAEVALIFLWLYSYPFLMEGILEEINSSWLKYICLRLLIFLLKKLMIFFLNGHAINRLLFGKN